MTRLESTTLRSSGALHPIPPLTRANSKDVLLERTEEVTVQIAGAIGAGAEQIREMASVVDPASAQYLGPECLVFLIRHFRAGAENDLVEVLAAALLKRCRKHIRSKLSTLEDPDRRKAAVDEVIDQLFRKVLDLDTDKGDFLQVRFWIVLDSLIVKAFNRAVKTENRMKREVPISALVGEDPDGSGDENDAYVARSAGDALLDPQSSPDWETIRGEALQALNSMDRRYAEAFTLKHYYGWQVEGEDDEVPTISRHFGKTPKTIRTWLHRAEAALERWRERAL